MELCDLLLFKEQCLVRASHQLGLEMELCSLLLFKEECLVRASHQLVLEMEHCNVLLFNEECRTMPSKRKSSAWKSSACVHYVSVFGELRGHTEHKRSRLKGSSRNTPEHPQRLDIPYSDYFNGVFSCHSCEMAQATKKHNRTPRERPGVPFQEIHTDMVEKSSQEDCSTRSACSPSATHFLDTLTSTPPRQKASG